MAVVVVVVVPETRGQMEDRHRRTRRLGSLATMSRVSKETKLRLRVIFLDDSERTFEVEVSLFVTEKTFSNGFTDYL